MNKKILLIDDDVDEFYILRESLADTGLALECVYSEDLPAGIIHAKNCQPDFIFLDIHMPGVDGFRGLSLLQEVGELNHIPIIFYSIDINSDIKTKAVRLGAYACIEKVNTIKNLAYKLEDFFLTTFSPGEGRLKFSRIEAYGTNTDIQDNSGALRN